MIRAHLESIIRQWKFCFSNEISPSMGQSLVWKLIYLPWEETLFDGFRKGWWASFFLISFSFLILWCPFAYEQDNPIFMCLQVMAATGPQLQELFMKDSIQDLVFSSGYSGVLCAASKERVVADVLLQNVPVLRHAALEQLAEGLTSLGVLDLLRGHVNMMSGLLVSPPLRSRRTTSSV